MSHPIEMTYQEPTRRAHCEFCGGKGNNLKVEYVQSAVGTIYRIPESHATCKQSALSLSLSLDEPAPSVAKQKRRSKKGIKNGI